MAQRDLSLFFLWGWLQVLATKNLVKACKQRYQVGDIGNHASEGSGSIVNDPESMRARVPGGEKKTPRRLENSSKVPVKESKRIAEGVRKWKQENRARRQRVDRKLENETTRDQRIDGCSVFIEASVGSSTGDC